MMANIPQQLIISTKAQNSFTVIEINSDFNQITRFTFRLPVASFSFDEFFT